MLIEYRGFRPRHADRLYGTGDWSAGMIKDVPEESGLRLLRHPDMFGAGKDDGKVETLTEATTASAARTIEDLRTQDARDSVNAMQEKQAVLDFALANYQRRLDPKLKLNELKRQAIRLIDQYGLP